MEIAAAPQTVWETATDTRNLTTILTNLHEQEILLKEGQDEIAVGTVVREVRSVLSNKQGGILL